MSSLKSISPLDGRYSDKTIELQEIFSEYGLMRCRINVEIEYFIFMLERILGVKISLETRDFLNNIGMHFDEEDGLRIKEIEKKTNHDVKAVEYFIKEKFIGKKVEKYKEYIHFGLTSQDVNSVSYVVQIKYYIENIFIKELLNLLEHLYKLADETRYIAMLGRTHGQHATPTTMGKELLVFTEKLKYQLSILDNVKYRSKFGGATGNLNAHYISYKDVDWEKQLDEFLLVFGIGRYQYTTQIDNYDGYAVIFDCVRRIQTVLVDFCQDIWMYISYDYFTLKKVDGEIGSSTMPHKVNPIDFENAEGNFLMSNNILQFLSNKLPVSRLQRDLTDSTLLRNLGVAFGYGLIGLKSVKKGISKLEINEIKISKELSDSWYVVLEGIQTILRREGFEEPYELVKKFLKDNKSPGKSEIYTFIENLDIDLDLKFELKRITPFSYCGRLLID